MCELLRGEAAMAGFTEILTWALCSHQENFEALRRVRAAALLGCRSASGFCMHGCRPAGRLQAGCASLRIVSGCSMPATCCYQLSTHPLTCLPLQQDDGTTAACIGNPATAEFEVCRTSLLPGALKTLGAHGLQLVACSNQGAGMQETTHSFWLRISYVVRLGPFAQHSHAPLLALFACFAGANRDAPLPVKLFEVSDVILLTGNKVRASSGVLCDA